MTNMESIDNFYKVNQEVDDENCIDPLKEARDNYNHAAGMVHDLLSEKYSLHKYYYNIPEKVDKKYDEKIDYWYEESKRLEKILREVEKDTIQADYNFAERNFYEAYDNYTIAIGEDDLKLIKYYQEKGGFFAKEMERLKKELEECEEEIEKLRKEKK